MAPASLARPTAYPNSAARALGARQDAAAQAPLQALPPWLTWSLTTAALPTPTPDAQGVEQGQLVFSVPAVDKEALRQVQPTQTYCGPSIPLGPGWVDCTAAAQAPTPTSTQGDMDDYPYASDQSGYGPLDDPWSADYPYATAAPTAQESLSSYAYLTPGETVITSSQPTQTLSLPDSSTTDVSSSTVVPTATHQATSTFTMPTAVPTSMASSMTLPTSTAAPSASSQAQSSGVKPTTIVAASIGGLVLALLLSVFLFLLCRRKRSRPSHAGFSPHHDMLQGEAAPISPAAAIMAAGNQWGVKRKPPPSPLSLHTDTAYHRDFCNVPDASLSVPSLLPPATGKLYVVNADQASVRDSGGTMYEQRWSLGTEHLTMSGDVAVGGREAGYATTHAVEQGRAPATERWAITTAAACNDALARGSSESKASMCSSLLPPPRPLASRAVVLSDAESSDQELLAQRSSGDTTEPQDPTSAQELTFQQRWNAEGDAMPYGRAALPAAPRSADSIYTVYGGAPLSPPLQFGTTTALKISRSRATRIPAPAVWPIARPPVRPLRAAARASPSAWPRAMSTHTSTSPLDGSSAQALPTSTRLTSEQSFSSTDSSGRRTSRSVNALSSLFSRRSFDSVTRPFVGGGAVVHSRSRELDLEQQADLPPHARAAGWSVTPEGQERHVRFNPGRPLPPIIYRDEPAALNVGLYASNMAAAAAASAALDDATRSRDSALPRPSFALTASDGAELWTQDSWQSRTAPPPLPSFTRAATSHAAGGGKRSRDSGAEQGSTIDFTSHAAPTPGSTLPLFSRYGSQRSTAAPHAPSSSPPRPSEDISTTQDSWQTRTTATAPTPALSTTRTHTRNNSAAHARSDSFSSAKSGGSALSAEVVRAHLGLSEKEENDLLPRHS